MWYLGFDCATKTLAFSLSRIGGCSEDAAAKLAAARECVQRAKAIIDRVRGSPGSPRAEADLAECRRIHGAVAAFVRDLAPRLLVLADGAMVDLFPGRADAEIPTVERVRAVVAFVETRVRAALAARALGEPLRVLVEYQMGANSAARTVAAAIIARFSDEVVFLVGPSLKNRVAIGEQGRYAHFAEKYKSSYAANKNHAAYNFARIEQAFGSSIPQTKAADRGHIADSFMQVLGFIAYGPGEERAALMF